MSQAISLRLQDYRALFELAGECRDLGDNNPLWQRHFLSRVARLVGSEVALGGELAGISTGQPRDIGIPVDRGFENGFNIAGWVRALELIRTDPTYSPVIFRYLKTASYERGTAMRRSDLITSAEWERSPEFDEVHKVCGVDHNMGCFRLIPGQTDEIVGAYFLRSSGRPDFSGRERLLVQEAIGVIAPMLGGTLSRISEPSPMELAPRVRQVLKCLLEGDGDKQIAKRLNIGVHTVNQYGKTIFRHFRVRSRAELMARWIKRGWGGGCSWAADPRPLISPRTRPGSA